MNNKKQKLELTWVGKGEEPKLEPRILIEDTDLSHGDPNTENMLIYGDNLLALKALEQDFTGKIKCIYIDPPYNTGRDFEHYEDGLEHSRWLSLIKSRISILRKLLTKNGFFFVQIDDYEADYLRVLCDEIFGRSNFRNRFYVARTAKSNNLQFENLKSYNNAVEQILCYASSPEAIMNKIFEASSEQRHIDGQWKTFFQGDDRKTMQYEILGAKIDSGHWIWNKERAFTAMDNYMEYLKYCKGNGFIELKDYWELTGKKYNFIKRVENSNAKDMGVRYWIPPKDGILITNNWTNLLTYANDGYFATAKSEKIIRRILEISTNENELVLDSFLGSGTTAAVAHKMNRRWIGVELGEHCMTHCIPRLEKVISGEDQGGISKSVNWQGGGGFKFYNLAPSLLKKDKFDNWVINPEYNPDMLAAAMAKHEGFNYNPSQEIYWKQGQSTEKDYIFTTTQFITMPLLDAIQAEMDSDESLLICCKAFSKQCSNKYPNITVKKIPKVVLGRCEFDNDDYSFNINSSANIDDDLEVEVTLEEDLETKNIKTNTKTLPQRQTRKSLKDVDQLTIFH